MARLLGVLAPEVGVGGLLVVGVVLGQQASEALGVLIDVGPAAVLVVLGTGHARLVPGRTRPKPSDADGVLRSRRSPAAPWEPARRAARRCTTTARGRGASAGSARCGGSGRPACARRRPRRPGPASAAPS